MSDRKSVPEISLIMDDLLYRFHRLIGLIPAEGLGIVRRAFFYAMVAWLPIVIWAVYAGRALPGSINEPLLQHFGIHVRFLIALPLLILGEGVFHNLTQKLIPYFRTSGLVRDEQDAEFRSIIQSIIRLRNSTLPWVVIGTILAAWFIFEPPHNEMHELAWANVAKPEKFDLGFGGWWMIYVSRPIFIALTLAWIWRSILLLLLLKRIASLNLAIVPSHPDRCGGLGFLQWLPPAYSLFAFSLSAVLASRLAHDVVYHGIHVQSLKLMCVVFLLAISLICLLPLLVFMPILAKTKRQSILEYGSLIGEHGRLVHRRWILKESLSDDSLLDAPEIGPVADSISIYEAVNNMRTTPIGKRAILAIVIPAALPLLALFAIEIPIKDLLLKIIGTLA